MLNKVRPTIKKYAKTPMRCRYVEKRMKLFWNAYIDQVFPRKFKYDLRWAYAHQIVGAAEELEDGERPVDTTEGAMLVLQR